MCSTIPTIRAQIKDASMSDLKDFLESIRRHCSRVGEAAMIQVLMRLILILIKFSFGTNLCTLSYVRASNANIGIMSNICPLFHIMDRVSI